MQTELLRRIEDASEHALVAYMQGALRDGTRSARHRTHRIGQFEREWLELLGEILQRLGYRGWIYREGRERRLWILETTAPFLSLEYDASHLLGRDEGLDYVRGYFDAEGGMPRDPAARLYFQFTQKDRTSLSVVRDILERHAVACGRIHNPSHRVNPEYWRFYVRAASQRRFIALVGSWHPRKSRQIAVRVEDALRLLRSPGPADERVVTLATRVSIRHRHKMKRPPITCT